MTTKGNAILVVTNLPDTDIARALARSLVEARLAACVNILPGVQSIYRWQGAVEEANEISLLIKAHETDYDALEAAIKAQHPYDLPEIIALPITAGLPAYMQWIEAETRKDVHV